VEPPGLLVPYVEAAAVGADPDVTGAIARHGRDPATGQVQAVLGTGPQVVESLRAAVVTRDAATEGAHPYLLVDFEQAHDTGCAETGGHAGVVDEHFGAQGPRIDAIQARAHGAHPQVAGRAFQHGHDPISAEAAPLALDPAQGGHLARGAIHQVDAGAEGADPQPAQLVFGERGDVPVRESFLGAGA
jgi:hypothetical protein